MSIHFGGKGKEYVGGLALKDASSYLPQADDGRGRSGQGSI